jgi:CRP-like cAMP-binding protein
MTINVGKGNLMPDATLPAVAPTVIAFLQETALFRDLNQTLLTQLTQDFRQRSYRSGDVIFHQGDEGRNLFVIMRGTVRVYHLSPGGEETTITILAPRQLLGEFSLLDGHPRSATAEAISTCTLLEMSAERCLYHLTHIPGLALALARQVVQKVRWTSMYAESLARMDAAGRFLHFLLLYNEELGQVVTPGKRYELNLGLTQDELASLIGARRQWVNKILGEWSVRELVAFDNGVLTILDLPRVQAERDSRMNLTG